MRAVASTAAIVLTVSLARGSRADLAPAAVALADAYRAQGARVDVQPTKFVFEGDRVALPVLARDPASRCTMIAIVGPRGLAFHAVRGGDERSKVSSAVGALEIASCDARGSEGALEVRVDSGRGALEAVVARSSEPMPSLRQVLSDRVVALPVAVEVGAMPAPAPAAVRIEAARAAARQDGAQSVALASLVTDGRGRGGALVTLDAGCHRFDLVALDAEGAHDARSDLDAELVADDKSLQLARDQGFASDARVEACVGESTPARLTFAGAHVADAVAVVHARWAMPAALGRSLGASSRARMLSALVALGVRVVDAPVALVLGGSGTSSTSVSTLPGACYAAVVAVGPLHAQRVALRVETSETRVSADRGAEATSAAVAFCAGRSTRATASVDLRGGGAWTLAWFRLSDGFAQP